MFLSIPWSHSIQNLLRNRPRPAHCIGRQSSKKRKALNSLPPLGGRAWWEKIRMAFLHLERTWGMEGNAYSLVLVFLHESTPLAWHLTSAPSLGGRDFSDWQPGRRTWAWAWARTEPRLLSLLSSGICLLTDSRGSACPLSHMLSGASVLSVLRGCDRSVAPMAECV